MKLIKGQTYHTASATTAKSIAGWIIVPAGQSLVFRKVEKRNNVSNWNIFSWSGVEIKLTDLACDYHIERNA